MTKTHECTCSKVLRPSGATRTPVKRRVVISGRYHETYKKTGRPKDTRRWGKRCTRCHGR